MIVGVELLGGLDMLEVRSAGVILNVPRGNSPEFRVHATFRGRSVRQAFAAISSFSFSFGNGDHNIEGLGVQIISVDIHGDRDEVTVRGHATFHDRGGNDDPYQARLTLLIFADVE